MAGTIRFLNLAAARPWSWASSREGRARRSPDYFLGYAAMGEQSPERKPWERQPYETAAAFRAFGYYLRALTVDGAYRLYQEEKSGGGKEEKTGDAGHNSREKPQKTARSPKSWRHWSHGMTSKGEAIPGAMTWKERALAWEEHVWEERRQRVIEMEWEMAEKAQRRVLDVLKTPLPDALPPAGAARLMEAASKLMRLAAGEPTDRKKIEHGFDTSAEEAVGEIAALLDAARAREAIDESGSAE